MGRRSAPSPEHREHAISRSDFARRSGRSKSSITEACSGPLADACLPNGRIDAAHPAAVAWAKTRKLDPRVLLEPLEARIAVSSTGRASLEELIAQGAYFVELGEFARLAGERLHQLNRVELAGIILPLVGGGEALNLDDDKATAYLVARPFRRNAAGKIIPGEIPKGFLNPAFDETGKLVDENHACARAFLARAKGEVLPRPARSGDET